jgi:hypothetical protein
MIISIVFALLLAGVLIYVVQAIPAIDPALKGFARVLVIAAVVIWCLVKLEPWLRRMLP